MQKRNYLLPLNELRLAHSDAQHTSLCCSTVMATTRTLEGPTEPLLGGSGRCRRGLEDVLWELSVQKGGRAKGPSGQRDITTQAKAEWLKKKHETCLRKANSSA